MSSPSGSHQTSQNNQSSFRSILLSLVPGTYNRLLSPKLLLNWKRGWSHGRSKCHKAVLPRLAGFVFIKHSLGCYKLWISIQSSGKVDSDSFLFCFVFASLLLLFERMYFWSSLFHSFHYVTT